MIKVFIYPDLNLYEHTTTLLKTGNVTLRRARATIVAVYKQILRIVSVWGGGGKGGPSYPACNAHAPYCHLWPVWFYNIFPHYLINGRIFEKRY
jgi:hypothetical protein